MAGTELGRVVSVGGDTAAGNFTFAGDCRAIG